MALTEWGVSLHQSAKWILARVQFSIEMPVGLMSADKAIIDLNRESVKYQHQQLTHADSVTVGDKYHNLQARPN